MFEWITSWFQAEPVPIEIKTDIDHTVNSNKVVVYSKTYCPYCSSTKSLFENLKVPNVKVVELNLLNKGSLIQRGLYEKTGQNTVPNIFINQKHVGGNSDLQALNAQGKLKQLLE
ncbi:unnamed protein product [Candida verbasci]|uniref:Glutaredoxin domain-containing protein n=1 Tax=Candida verbasci TaxID=1227364 RepID=A0A9W4TZ02_9ASCO|nr:unnamed protein product [Candida verbasci]